MNKRHVISLAVVMVLLAASLPAQVYQVDYSVYFWPSPGPPVQPEKSNANGQIFERLYAIVYNVGQTPGTHPYQLQLRAIAPNGRVACETTTLVEPWSGTYTMKKVAFFEARYQLSKTGDKLHPSAVKPGKYLLHAYLTEQIPTGQPRQDTDIGNNQYPFAPPQEIPVAFEVRPGAQEIRCAPTFRPPWDRLPAGFTVPAPH